MPELGQFLKEKRESSGLSLKRLSSITGISDSELLKIENGTRKKPGWEHLCKIAKALNFHPFEVLLNAGYISKNDIHPPLLISGLEAGHGEPAARVLGLSRGLRHARRLGSARGGPASCVIAATVAAGQGDRSDRRPTAPTAQYGDARGTLRPGHVAAGARGA